MPRQTKILLGGTDGGLHQVLTNLFCKMPDDKYLSLHRPEVSVTTTHSALTAAATAEMNGHV